MRARWILQCAALLAPNDEREEWLAEWRAEAAYVRDAGGSAQTMRFCLGAFRDALWLRRNRRAASAKRIMNSPVKCLAVLAVSAAICMLIGLRPSGALRGISSPAYREPEKLAMVSRIPGKTPTFAQIPVAEYWIASHSASLEAEVAFYAPKLTWADSKRFVLAVASPNLFRLLGVPAPRSGLVMRWSAVHRCFKDDPRIVGREIEVADSKVEVAAVIPDGSWRLPGFVDGWLLDDGRLASLPAETNGFMVARLHQHLANSRAKLGDFGFAPLPQDHPLLALVLVTGLCLAFLPAAAPFGLGAYASNNRRWSTRARRWGFMAIKLTLLIPIVVCGAFGIGLLPISPQAFVIGSILALRWAISDQRSRCPVCLHSLSHPVTMGEASHTFLDWYGTEFVCARGHGFLHVAAVRTSCSVEQRWLAFG